MNSNLIETMFDRIGARARVSNEIDRRNRAGIDISTDKQGEFFDIRVAADDVVEYQVVDIRPDMKHLLLMARRDNGKQKFLCGHDERRWFVCAVPGQSVSNVVNAMEALQPRLVRGNVHRRVKRVKDRLRRRNRAFVRQGEWFFVPVQTVTIDKTLVIRNERLMRGAGAKPHMCQFLFRNGGDVVWVSSKYPQGVSRDQYRRILLTEKGAKEWNWKQMMRDPKVYVRGRVWHPDHKTIVLNDWHRVLMNTEAQAPGARAVVFLD